MGEYLKHMRFSFLLASILYLVLGAVLLFWPVTTSNVICYAIGGILLLYGAVTLVGFLRRDSAVGAVRPELLLGVLATGLGAVFLLWPQVILSFLPVVFGIYLAADSLINLKRAAEMRRCRYERWYIAVILSLIGVALGVFVFFHPYLTATNVIRVIGGVFLYQGISDLWSIRKVTVLLQNAPIESDPIDVE